MSDEFQDIGHRIPDMQSMLMQRISAKKAEESGTSPLIPGTFDPYQVMLKKKREEAPTSIDPSTIKQWPEQDVKKLEDYCQKMGIVGFNCGKMHPVAALSMLKQRFGEDFSNVPLEERVPEGYQKIGTKSSYGLNDTYEEIMHRKHLLLG